MRSHFFYGNGLIEQQCLLIICLLYSEEGLMFMNEGKMCLLTLCTITKSYTWPNSNHLQKKSNEAKMLTFIFFLENHLW